MKKKVDPRIRQVLQDAVSNNQRAFMLLVGDKARDQVVNLHYMLSKLTVTSRPTVLWCYKKELGFSSNKKKRMKVIKKRIKQGLVDAEKDDPFELFISATTIRFAYYADSHKVLGNTYGMCVLQDFEALTPNLLARTIETVSGGGLIVLLIRTMTSLKQLFSLTMDVHSRLRTDAFSKVVPRFNERFILSLADCRSAIVADDELNVLPISSRVRALSGQTSIPGAGHGLAPAAIVGKGSDAAPELVELRASLEDTHPIGALVAKAKTIDQAKALLTFEEAISEKTLRATVALTASRGRGKSAALGLAVAAAVAHDYSNIFVTAPSPENLRTFFAFLLVGFDALEYQEHTDYEIVQSSDPALGGAVVRVNVFQSHRQTVQYIDPTDAPRFLSQAELLVIDEAAAIPLPVVEAMLGPYVVFMCSTVTGYEGTGRSLSLKLIKKLRDGSTSRIAGGPADGGNKASDRAAVAVASRSGSGRVFREVRMETPIRYSENDPVEAWLYDLLCLRAGGVRQPLTTGAPHPDACSLYYVERDALFSRHQASEAFLQRVIALFVSSHYKNSPNDLQMLSDAPAHGLFVLLAPTGADCDRVPDVLVAIQVCLEGRVGNEKVRKMLGRGERGSGDLIPWTVSQQFQEADFATLSGARVVRVATHPDLQKMGYGTRALKLLLDYYAGKMISLDESNEEEAAGREDGVEESNADVDVEKETLLDEVIGPRENIPPLLRRLHERQAEKLDYLGVSYGLTQGLYAFWSKLGFSPLYMRLTPNELTGEHTCIMATTAVSSGEGTEWLNKFHEDFRRRFLHLLAYDFRKFTPAVAISVLRGRSYDGGGDSISSPGSAEDVERALNVYDRKRLESYSRNLVDYHVIVDMLPRLAELYSLGAFSAIHADEAVNLSAAQEAILVALGLQKKSVTEVERELKIESAQVLALLNKVIRKLTAFVRKREEKKAEDEIGGQGGQHEAENRLGLKPMRDLDAELGNGGGDEGAEKKAIKPSLEKYRIASGKWDEALGERNGGGKREDDEKEMPTVLSVKTSKVKRQASESNTPRNKKRKKKT